MFDLPHVFGTNRWVLNVIQIKTDDLISRVTWSIDHMTNFNRVGLFLFEFIEQLYKRFQWVPPVSF